ncbi:expressed protein [Phakopsora pachyrhizi]|uniref:Expressed protein n=1 Tax=Phakopsora pachyrhizi TaxID=170000 RepID=A0AAV0BH86_PHAPC|nr:expressed protein [Phakopsora pachyrhizi]
MSSSPAKRQRSDNPTFFTSGSTWVRCPRSPCVVSYNPRNSLKHYQACRYLRCPNSPCSFSGPLANLDLHKAECPHMISSEAIGTTDPISDSSSEVLDILTSPARRLESYPTEPTSEEYLSQSSSSREDKCIKEPILSSKLPVAGPSRLEKTFGNLNPRFDASPSRKRVASGCRSRMESWSTVDPYDPSAKRIFSLADGAIDSRLRPASSKSQPPQSSSSPPPARTRLSNTTLELQEFMPSTDEATEELIKLEAKLAQTRSQLLGLENCYKQAISDIEELIRRSQNFPHHPMEIAASKIPVESYRRSLKQIRANLTPDPIPETEFESESEYDSGTEDESSEDYDEFNEQDKVRNDDEIKTDEGRQVPLGHLALSCDRLRSLVRLRILEAEERSSPQPGMGSPRNLFDQSRKRKLSEFSEARPCLSSSPQRKIKISSEISEEVPEPNSGSFVRKLVDTTWDPVDEIEVNPLPPICNFYKFIYRAQAKKSREEL